MSNEENEQRYQAALEGYLQKELAGIPEDMRDMVPALDITAKLEWLEKAKTRGIFDRSTEQRAIAASIAALTDDERAMARSAGMTDEQYAQLKTT